VAERNKLEAHVERLENLLIAKTRQQECERFWRAESLVAQRMRGDLWLRQLDQLR
jgi:hypothetical protein